MRTIRSTFSLMNQNILLISMAGSIVSRDFLILPSSVSQLTPAARYESNGRGDNGETRMLELTDLLRMSLRAELI